MKKHFLLTIIILAAGATLIFSVLKQEETSVPQVHISYLDKIERINDSYFLTLDIELQEEDSCGGISDGLSPDPGVHCVDLLHAERKQAEFTKGSSLEVSDNVRVLVYSYNDELEQSSISIDEFFKLQDQNEEYFYYGLNGIQDVPFRFTVEDNRVVSLEQIYIP